MKQLNITIRLTQTNEKKLKGSIMRKVIFAILILVLSAAADANQNIAMYVPARYAPAAVRGFGKL